MQKNALGKLEILRQKNQTKAAIARRFCCVAMRYSAAFEPGFVRKRTPSVFGPQWLLIVQLA